MRGISRGTWALIAASAAAFVVDALTGHRLLAWGAKSAAIWTGEWHRLVTPNFIHYGVMHLAFDMYALYIFGRIVEELAGTLRFLFVYFLSGCIGFLASLWAHPEGLSVGASAAIFGLMGYTIHYRLRRLPWRWLSIDASFAQILLLNLVIGFTVPNIDQFAHLGGFIAGALAGSVTGFPPHHTPAGAPWLRRPERGWAEKVAAGAVALVLLWAGISPLSFAERAAGFAPQFDAAVRARFGKYFAPYILTSPGLFWLDVSSPEAEWTPVDRRIQLPRERPLAFGLFGRWIEGRKGGGAMRYTVTWERLRDGEWVEEQVEPGSVSRPDPRDDRIYRRGLLVGEGSLAGRWRVRVEGGGAVHFQREFIVHLE